MEKYLNEHNRRYSTGKRNGFITVITLIASLIMSSCSVVSSIFKAGMDFGIFIVIAIIVIIAFIVIRLGRNRNK